jgi:hypothetical protein
LENKFDDSEEEISYPAVGVSPEYQTNFLLRFTYRFINPVLNIAYKKHEQRIKKGIKTTLQISDLYDLPVEDDISPVFERFDHHWTLEKKQPK